ncbi:heavy-metal-associated domain-containing protein [Panacibacter ginsenosidivorans]|uniref:Heavy-metal-associated domain-containing protein n=1 Tax=Panacibacter ginsenosidivorans TaxID=1813871 RepID=A0A5B8V8A5_9BACT|nr:heavy metal-associated domain-containing protein [Panacibacter ginsenosidivorans]QEC67459.1 heavy-metal-associated domain-containing protein [Panacibacter ginsenosidivorans]
MLSTETFLVENIKCDGCIVTITNSLMHLREVQSVNVYKDQQKVCVTGIAMDRDIIKSRLALLGYPEKASNNLLKKAKSLLHCVIS